MTDINHPDLQEVNDLMELTEEFRRIRSAYQLGLAFVGRLSRLHDTTGNRLYATLAHNAADDVRAVEAKATELARALHDRGLLEEVLDV